MHAPRQAIGVTAADPRRGSVLVLASALLLLATVAGCNGSDAGVDTTAVMPRETVASAGTVSLPAAVDTYVRFTDSLRAADAMGVDHEYTATGIRNLAAALEAIGGTTSGADVQRELTTLRQQADELQRNAQSTQHATQARTAFISLTGLMSAMQQARFPGLDSAVASVREAAEAVSAERPLLDQRAAVQTFFERSADAVRQMSGDSARVGAPGR